MKKVLLIVAMLALASPSFAYISGSAHDFSGNNWTTDNRICQACHTPHGGDTTISDAPLWNHDLTSESWVGYSSSTLNANITTAAVIPTGITALCMSCHDGSVALDAFGGATGSVLISAPADLTNDGMANDHPVGFVYDSSLATADGELRDPATFNTVLGDTIANDLLFGGRLECASCHDVHNSANNGAGYPKMTVMSNSGSQLCLTCHNK